MTDKLIYLDYNATTPVDPLVLDEMLPYFTERFGNSASRSHRFGWVAEAAVKIARESVAELIGASPEEIYFTSGATEAINFAIKGIAANYKTKGDHIITTSIEHKAVLDTLGFLAEGGFRVTYIAPTREGIVDIDHINAAITDRTILICVMYANNETGMMQPVKKIGELARSRGILFMTDATQAVGKVSVDVNNDNIDILTLSAHKFYGPKGVGAIYLRRRNPRVSPLPLLHGGGHENGMRSGTLNVPGIVGLGKACRVAQDKMWDDASLTSTLRTILEQELVEMGGVYVNGSQKHRLPNVTNLSLTGVSSVEFIRKLKHIAVSTGSACTSAVPEPSYVLTAMGLSEEMAYSSIRFSLGRFTTKEEVETVIRSCKDLLAERGSV